MEPIETINYRGFDIEVHQDTEPENPREWDNLGTMVCFHNRYELGDKHDLQSSDFTDWNEIENYLIREEKAFIILPLYLYDHSGLRIKIGSFRGLLPQGHAEFDSGMIGFIYITRETILKEFGKKRITNAIRERVISGLHTEIEVYDNYLSGNVYGFCIIDSIGETIESVWGYNGAPEEYMIGEAKDVIDAIIQTRIQEHCNQVKTWIRNSVPLTCRKPLSI